MEEDFGWSGVDEVRCRRVEDAVVEAVIAGVVSGKAPGDGGGPEDEPALVVRFVVKGGGPGVDGARLVGEYVELLVWRPVNEVGGGGVADGGRGVPGPGPDEMEAVVGTALQKGVTHEFIRLGLMEDGTVLIGDGPVVAVGTDGVVDALFAVAFETGEEP